MRPFVECKGCRLVLAKRPTRGVSAGIALRPGSRRFALAMARGFFALAVLFLGLGLLQLGSLAWDEFRADRVTGSIVEIRTPATQSDWVSVVVNVPDRKVSYLAGTQTETVSDYRVGERVTLLVGPRPRDAKLEELSTRVSGGVFTVLGGSIAGALAAFWRRRSSALAADF